MATGKQALGEFGEIPVGTSYSYPKCDGDKTLKRLLSNFKCADLFSDFYGYLTPVNAKPYQTSALYQSKYWAELGGHKASV